MNVRLFGFDVEITASFWFSAALIGLLQGGSDPGRMVLWVLVVLVSGLLPVFVDRPFLAALWTDLEPYAHIAVGSPIVFDIGVCLIVIGVVLTMTFHLAED